MFHHPQFSSGGYGRQADNASELFGTVVGIIVTVIYIPLAWEFTVPYIVALAKQTWGEGVSGPISALWAVCLAVIMFSATKSSAKIMFAAVVMIIARLATLVMA